MQRKSGASWNDSTSSGTPSYEPRHVVAFAYQGAGQSQELARVPHTSPSPVLGDVQAATRPIWLR
jgi:hypothetical protein